MAQQTPQTRRKFGTAPVFLTAISTILGAVMFLRFGFAVGNLGFLGTVGIILLGHLVTIPTAMAIAEIATNQRVQGGGEYFIISRSFGILVGAAVGVALYFSQAISVAFYVIAFGEAFSPVFEWLGQRWGGVTLDKRIVTIPAVTLLSLLMLTKGANVGVKALYIVVATLFVSLAFFFLGGGVTPSSEQGANRLLATIENPQSFFVVFAICFPAFTGMTAGVGLSGDLRNPRRSIPLGTLAATLFGMFIYVFIAWKLATSASPQALASDQLIMSKIALWGPIIPIGLACATFSSALGSFLVAPRTLQALASDGIFPSEGLNDWLARGKAVTNEPVRGSLVTAVIALAFVAVGDVDFVAQIISMIFMVTYGSLCLISFLQHFAADPSYRPVFRSRWYISLFGAAMCLWLMFSMSPVYAALSITLLVITYALISRNNPDRSGLATLFLEAFFQMSRKLQVFLQKSKRAEGHESWRPSVVGISRASFQRRDLFDLLRWIAHRYGFGMYIHYIEGYLSRQTHAEAQYTLQRLVRMADVSEGNVYVDTLVAPSYDTAISQLVQLQGIGGRENNMILLEFPKDRPEDLAEIVNNLAMVMSTDFEVCILASSSRGFGYRREIHVWLRPGDYDNAGLMVMLAFVVVGHAEWKKGHIKVFALFPEAERDVQEQRLLKLIQSGRLPITAQNVEFVPEQPGVERKQLVVQRSFDADLTILGFHASQLKRSREQLLSGFDDIGNVLFVTTTKEIELTADEEPEPEEAPGPSAELAADEDTKAAAPEVSEQPASADEATAATEKTTDAEQPEAVKKS